MITWLLYVFKQTVAELSLHLATPAYLNKISYCLNLESMVFKTLNIVLVHVSPSAAVIPIIYAES